MSSVQHFHVSAIITAVLNVSLVVLVLRFAPVANLKRRFVWYGCAISTWSFFLLLFSSSPVKEQSYLFCQLLHAASIFIPCLFLHFVFAYLGHLNQREKKILIFVYLVSAVFWLSDLFWPHYFIANVIPKLGFHYFMSPGVLYYPWTAWFFLIVMYGHIVLLKGALDTVGYIRKQRLFFLIGNFIGYMGGLGTFYPVYNITYFPYPYGTYGVALFSLVTAYTIIKFRFMDIEVIIKRTLVFAGIVAVAVGGVSLPLQLLVSRFIEIPSFWLVISSVVTTVLIYRPLDHHLTNLTDRFLFQKKYDYRKLLKDAAAGISQIKSLNQLLSLVVHFMTMRIRTRNASMLLHDEQNNYFRSAFTRGYPVEGWLKSGHIFNEQDPLIDYLEHERQPIDIERVKEYIETGGPKTKKGRFVRQYDYKLIKVKMDELLAACCVPSFLGNRLLGVLVLGEKKSGDAYSDEDLAVLFTIAQESAIAIENARLYDQAIEKAKELEIINENLNSAQTSLLRALRDTEEANKKLQETQAALISAEKKATMVGMAQAIGHEVYNPLVPISGKAQHIYMIHVKKYYDILSKYRQGMKEEDARMMEKTIKETDAYAHAIVNNVDRVHGVVRSLTGTLKESSGEMGPLSLAVLFERVLQVSRFTTGEENLAGCEVKMDIADNLMVRGNPNQLDEVFLNLVKNAYEAMGHKEGRRIDIRIRIDAENHDMARIDFSDNGPGIPPEILPKIWQQGFSTKQLKDDSIGASGQGHGLFVCKHIIEGFHGGTITVTSTLGKGTTFIIKLPVAEAKD